MRHTILLDLDPLQQNDADEYLYFCDYGGYPDDDDWAQLAVFIESEYPGHIDHHAFNEARELRRKHPGYKAFSDAAAAKGWEINHAMRLG